MSSAPGKFDYSSSGGGPLYRSNFTTQMERSNSFRESMEHPTMLRATSTMSQTDVTNFFQCLRFDPKVVAADHKSIRQGDFKRHVNIALGIQQQGDELSPSKGKLVSSHIPEEIKRLKAGLRENNVKARERVKIFNEASSVFNKFFPSVPTKKRSRPEDRYVSGLGLGKMGIQGQTLADGVPNKRTRTSMMDVRSNSIVRQSVSVERDKEIMWQGNHNDEEQTSTGGIDGWEKSKMKKKRSCIKTGYNSNKAVDGYRDLKQNIQQKSTSDSRSRLNGDSNTLRQANGATTGYGRSDSISQQTSLAGHSPLPRVDSDHSSFYSEKKECPSGSDAERVNLKSVNKYDEVNSSNLISNTKANASVRGPRSGTGLPPKLSPGLHNTPSPNDWDIYGCTNKPPTPRKRMTSSPPVTQWASQRPQKISRIARRTNLVPIISSKDEVPYSDSETGFGFLKRSPASAASPKLKLKGESSFSTAVLSESEESGPSENKGKQSDDIEGNIPKLHSRKNNKSASGEEIKDGVRRQGRTGRGFSSTRSPNTMRIEKLKNVGTTKQLRSAKPVFDKSESKVGRPPSRKLSGRKAYKRQTATTTTNAPTLDFHVGSDDGQEELLAAVNSAINFAQNFPNSFWKQMERYFCFISDDHINFMKYQGETSTSFPTSSGSDLYHEELATAGKADFKPSLLYKRLLSALISEDSMSVNEDLLQVDGFGDIDDESEFSLLNNGFDEPEDGWSEMMFHCNGKLSDDSPMMDFSDIQYDKLGIDEKIYLEAQSIGISLEPMPSISNVEDEGIADEIKMLEDAISKEGCKKKEMVDGLLKPAIEMKELQEKELDQLGYEKLIEMAYEKSKASRRHHNAGGKNSNNKISKQAASAFVKRTLVRCHQYEETGKSCFSEPQLKNMFISRLATTTTTDDTSLTDKEYNNPSTSRQNYVGSSEQTTGKEDTNGVKKRELLLDDVQLSTSTKGKRSDRDRDGKGQAKIGRPKAKPKQKTTTSVRITEQPKPDPLPNPIEFNNNNNLEEEDTEPFLDLSQLQIPDGLGGPDDFDTQPGDIGSWFNLDDEEDFDILELGIPMDDLSGLNIKL